MAIFVWIVFWLLGTYALAAGLSWYISKTDNGNVLTDFFNLFLVYGFIIVVLCLGILVIGSKIIWGW